jgi:hypothetical protein
MMARSLEHHGAIVYILGRRFDKLDEAARLHTVRIISVPKLRL